MYDIMLDNRYDTLVFGLLAMFCGMLGVILVMSAVTAEPRQQITFALGILTFSIAFIFRMLQLFMQ